MPKHISLLLRNVGQGIRNMMFLVQLDRNGDNKSTANNLFLLTCLKNYTKKSCSGGFLCSTNYWILCQSLPTRGPTLRWLIDRSSAKSKTSFSVLNTDQFLQVCYAADSFLRFHRNSCPLRPKWL